MLVVLIDHCGVMGGELKGLSLMEVIRLDWHAYVVLRVGSIQRKFSAY